MSYQLLQTTDSTTMVSESDATLPLSSSLDFVTNGSLDFKGRVANKRKTGGWKATPFIIGTFFKLLHTLRTAIEH